MRIAGSSGAILLGLFLLCAAFAGGCVERTITVNSSPPGALVYLNDEEIGRTPVTRDFLWYGDYSVTLREDGFKTVKTHQLVVAPFYEFVPLDIFFEYLPFHFHDAKEYGYIMQPLPLVDDQTLFNRALELKGQLGHTEIVATQPAGKSGKTTKATKKATTKESATTEPATR